MFVQIKNRLFGISNIKKNFFSTSLSLSTKEDKGKAVATNEWLAEQEKKQKQKDLEDLQKHKDEQIKSDHELASSLYHEEWGSPHYEGESEHSYEKGRDSRSVSPEDDWDKKVISALLFEADTCEKEGNLEKAAEYRKEVMIKLEEFEKKASGSKGESSSSAVAESSSSTVSEGSSSTVVESSSRKLGESSSNAVAESSSSSVAESSSSKTVESSAQLGKKSPLDYVIEKEEGEMPGPGDDFD